MGGNSFSGTVDTLCGRCSTSALHVIERLPKPHESRDGCPKPRVEWRVPEVEVNPAVTLSTSASRVRPVYPLHRVQRLLRRTRSPSGMQPTQNFSATRRLLRRYRAACCSREEEKLLLTRTGLVRRSDQSEQDRSAPDRRRHAYLQDLLGRPGGGPAAAGRDIRATTRTPILTPERDPRTWARRVVRRHPGPRGISAPTAVHSLSPSGGRILVTRRLDA